MAGVGQEVLNIFATVSAKGVRVVDGCGQVRERRGQVDNRQNTIATVRPPLPCCQLKMDCLEKCGNWQLKVGQRSIES